MGEVKIVEGFQEGNTRLNGICTSHKKTPTNESNAAPVAVSQVYRAAGCITCKAANTNEAINNNKQEIKISMGLLNCISFIADELYDAAFGRIVLCVFIKITG